MYTNFPLYPTEIFTVTDYPVQTDNTDTVYAALINALRAEMQACFAELGALPKGEYSTVAARLDAIQEALKIIIDYMEYASNALAQSAYVSSDSVGYSDNLIPDMTSNILPSGIASSDSERASYEAWRAMDKVTSSGGWQTVFGVVVSYLQYKFATSKTITRYTISGAGSDYDIKDWTFKGSNNGSDWDTLDTVTGETDWEAEEKRTFDFSNTTAYLYYKVDITANDGSLYHSTIMEIEMMDNSGVGNLQCYSDNVIPEQGTYCLKVTALKTDSLNDTLTHAISPSIDLTGKTKIKLWARSNRTGQNFKVEYRDGGGETISYTVNILVVDTWEEKEIDISEVTDVNKDDINQIKYTILNADAEAIFYLDNNFSI